MKATAIVRNLDRAWRIVLPRELRSTFNIKENDGLEIFVEEDQIILKKYISVYLQVKFLKKI